MARSRRRGAGGFKVTYIDTLTLLALQASPHNFGSLVIPRPGLVLALYAGVTSTNSATRSYATITIDGGSYDFSQLTAAAAVGCAGAIGGKVMAAGTYAFAATSANSLGSICAVWLIEGYISPALYDFAFNQTAGGTALGLTHDYPGRGVVLSAQIHYNTNTGSFDGPGAITPEGPFADGTKSGGIAEMYPAVDSGGESDIWSWTGSNHGVAMSASIR